ncbi:MAG TPA: efflux RND transporter periplasmic adaptor subunit [Nitrospirota bacterium]|nr:efflux RND transporter periplasmic adaptor subunit [Nitrospirota bacterium]
MAAEELAKLKIDKSNTVYHGRKRPKTSIIAAAIIVFLLLGWVLYWYVLNPTVEVEAATVSLVYPSQTFTLLNASGYVVAQRKAAVSSKATGRLDWLGVEEGSRVKENEVIARLEDRDVVAAREQAAANIDSARAALVQAQAELHDATLNYNRNKDLLAKDFVAQMDFDSADARYRKAQAGVSSAESAIGAAQAAFRAADVAVEYTRIRAPFDAVVLTKDADVGDIVTPFGAAVNAKASVVTIADMASLQVEADVSESNLEKVKKGQPCEIQLDALPDQRFRGEVHMIVPTADRSKASVTVKVRFLEMDPRILPEMSAKVAFLEHAVTLSEEKPKIALTAGTVVEHEGKHSVFLVTAGRVTETPVHIGGKIGDMLEVLDGVKAGDRVVLHPPKKLRTGTRITIKEG